MIRSEVELCRTILDGMAGNVARATEEVPITISITQLMATILKDSQWCQRVRVTLSERIGGQLVSLSIQAVTQAVRGVLQNILDASELDQMEVLLSAVLCGARLFMKIRDCGRRMTDQALARTGLAFMSTASLSHDAMSTRLGTCEFSTFDGSPTTNGSRVAVERARRLVDLDIDFIQIEALLECETILPPARLQLERLLAQHEEAALFWKMNNSKRRTLELRDRLILDRPSTQWIEEIEDQLAQVLVIRNGLVIVFMKLAASITQRMVNRECSFDELASAAHLTLIAAVQKFDYRRDHSSADARDTT